MSIYHTRLKPDGAMFVAELQEKTGATNSAIIAALLDYLALYKKEETMDFMLHRVAFYTKGYRFKRKG